MSSSVELDHLAHSKDYGQGGFEVVAARSDTKSRARNTRWWEAGREVSGARCGTLWRVCAAEASGAALLLLLSCLRACTTPNTDPLAARALGAGLTVAFVVASFDHVSGAQVNPTVTLAAVLSGSVAPARGAAMAVAQVAGASLGAAALAFAPASDLRRALTLPASNVTNTQAIAVEALLGFCLALVNLSSWDPRNRRLVDSWPIRIGLSVAGLTFAAADLTGASINPARSFAPALLTGDWHRHWIYWVGPLTGSAVAAALYSAVWSAPPHAPARPVADPAHTHAPARVSRPTPLSP